MTQNSFYFSLNSAHHAHADMDLEVTKNIPSGKETYSLTYAATPLVVAFYAEQFWEQPLSWQGAGSQPTHLVLHRFSVQTGAKHRQKRHLSASLTLTNRLDGV